MTGAALDARVRVHRGAYTLDAQLQAAAGQVVAVMGPSGAGKTTLLHAVAGFIPRQDGDVRVAGRPAAARDVVLLGQRSLLFPHLNVRDNVAFGLRARRVPRRAARAQADAWLDRVGLAGFGDRRPAQLSGGQQQRAALARALVTAPPVLLLDEPLTSLDTVTASDVRELLRTQLAATGTTAVIATHDVVDAASLASWMLVLESGRVTQHGVVHDVLRHPRTVFAAALAGVQRLVGHADAGMWRCGDVRLTAADADSRAAAAESGAALVAFVRPADVRLHGAGETGRAVGEAGHSVGEWAARVERCERIAGGVRVHASASATTVVADVSADRVAGLGLAPGTPVVVRIDPADVRFVHADEQH